MATQTRAFLVHVIVDDATDPLAIAEDIKEAVIEEGYDVTKVAPWSSPSDALAQAVSALNAIGMEPPAAGDLNVGGLGIQL